MAWSVTYDFKDSQHGWIPIPDTEFGTPRAAYTLGVGFTSVDIRTIGTSNYSRLLDISTTFSSTEITDITMNFNYTKGSTKDGASSAWNPPSPSTDFDSTVNGSGLERSISYGVNRTTLRAFIRSSLKDTAVFSGSITLNSVTVTGPSSPPPEWTDYTLIPSSGSGAGVGGAVNSFSPNQSGSTLFFAMENNSGNQVILKVNRPTSTTPTTAIVYNPLDGSAANISKHPDIDKMLFHGNFGTDVGAIEHAIAAITNTDISPTSIGAKLIQPLRVDLGDGQHIIAINRDDQDAIETEDGGSNWSTLNATLGQTVDAMDVGFFGTYIDDVIVIGGNDSTDENLGYSPNEAVSFREDTSAALKAVGSIVSIDRINI